MSLLSKIRSLFSRRELRKASLDGIGQFHEDRYGWWTGVVWLPSRKDGVGVTFKTGEELPGERETSFWRHVADEWPQLWRLILDGLRRDLSFPSDEDGDQFFAEIRPLAFHFHELTPGIELWEIDVEPDYSHHSLRIEMRGLTYSDFHMDG